MLQNYSDNNNEQLERLSSRFFDLATNEHFCVHVLQAALTQRQKLDRFVFFLLDVGKKARFWRYVIYERSLNYCSFKFVENHPVRGYFRKHAEKI